MDCPSCSGSLEEQTFENRQGQAIVLDLCYPCHSIWFDPYESLQLSAGSIHELFKLIHDRQRQPRNRLATRLECPRCRKWLLSTHDMQRATRFHYYRCPQEHGRFITYFQFLREKNFVRGININ